MKKPENESQKPGERHFTKSVDSKRPLQRSEKQWRERAASLGDFKDAERKMRKLPNLGDNPIVFRNPDRIQFDDLECQQNITLRPG
jgi:hypothetical protein